MGWVHGGVSLCVPCDTDMLLRGCCTSTGMMLCKLSPPSVHPVLFLFHPTLHLITVSSHLLSLPLSPISILFSLQSSLLSPFPPLPLLSPSPHPHLPFLFPLPYSLNLLFFLQHLPSICPNTAGFKVLLIQFDRDSRHVTVCAR